MRIISRKLAIRKDENFFLWGPRQVGKSSFLKEHFQGALYLDLLLNDQFIKYSTSPELLRLELQENSNFTHIIIDEVQRIPALLNEVHWLIENSNFLFGLCGSSARKLKRGQANLLGGRAFSYKMFGLTSIELGELFDLSKIINRGFLPRAYLSDEPDRILKAYVDDYLREEILEEGLVRNLPIFSNFLKASAFSDAEILNYSNIACECGISNSAVCNYFEILSDTMIGYLLPAYTRRPKRRIIHSPKFYLFDVGIANYLTKRSNLQIGTPLFGKAFENFIIHEVRCYCGYYEKNLDLSYWRLTTQVEVDLIINDMESAIEIKSSKKINKNDLKGLRALKEDHPSVKQRILICNVDTDYKTEDGIRVLNYRSFLKQLWNGELF